MYLLYAEPTRQQESLGNRKKVEQTNYWKTSDLPVKEYAKSF